MEEQERERNMGYFIREGSLIVLPATMKAPLPSVALYAIWNLYDRSAWRCRSSFNPTCWAKARQRFGRVSFLLSCILESSIDDGSGLYDVVFRAETTQPVRIAYVFHYNRTVYNSLTDGL